MIKQFKNIVLIIFLVVLGFSESNGQFYNGLQMEFGKNRVQYQEFYWQFYRFKRFDTYFYVGGSELARFTAQVASEKLNEIESFFEYTLEKRIIFVVYNKLSDFRQSNIGLEMGSNKYNIGGVTKIVDNKVFVYFEGNHDEMRRQVTEAVAEVVLNEMLYGSDLKNKMANSTLLSLPDWYTKGIVSYVANDWNYDIENRVKDGILSGRFEKFNRLTGQDAVYAGHSIWNYIAQKYGERVIPTIIYLTRISKNVESGFLYVLGIPLKYLAYDWINFYDKQYYEVDEKQNLPSGKPLRKRFKKSTVYDQAKLSPDGDKIAFVTNEIGKYKVWLADVNTGKRKKIIRRGHKLDQITDYSYPLVAWHPTGQIISFITEEKGKLNLYFYNLDDKKLTKRPIFGLEKIFNYNYSSDGFKLVLSGMQEGQIDIYIYNIAASSATKVTDDFADDLYPDFINNDKEIIFSSNRNKDTINVENVSVGADYDIYLCKTDNPDDITQITDNDAGDENFAGSPSINKFFFTGNQSGVNNKYIASYDSAVSFIDTSIHYRYYTNPIPVSNYKRDILSFDKSESSPRTAEILFYKNKHRIYIDSISINESLVQEVNKTVYRQYVSDQKQLEDSLKDLRDKERLEDAKAIGTEKNMIDINNYIFEIEKEGGVRTGVYSEEYDSLGNIKLPHRQVYFTAFYTDYLVNQIDFGFLNSGYQTFTGGEVYFNPGFNVLFKVGVNDLFEDYKLIGGFRFAGNFDSNEYLLMLENLKERLDKQYYFHRQAFTTVTPDFYRIKSHSHEMGYVLKYPFSQVSAIKGTATLRNDRSVVLSTDILSLNEDNLFKNWGGLKLEYIFDNTRNQNYNILFGTRFKLWFEAYHELDRKKSDLFVAGCDFRNYIPIHRNLIFANRIAAGTSFGHQKLVYYLGATDNWINLSRDVSTFDYSIPIDRTQNYAYQALATNMRGFTQNIRNGNNFVVMNNELRWPIVRYFANRPINSDFFANFQLIGFYDIGTAWTGESPYLRQAYNDEVIENGPVTIIIDKQREPIVMGYGFGVRSKLLGYFVRADWAWGIENNILLPRMFYLSLSLDF